MTDFTPYPEGISGQLNVYLTSDETGLEVCLNISGLPKPVEVHSDIANPKTLMDSLGQTFEGLEAAASDWRFMTRAEIKEYIKDNEG